MLYSRTIGLQKPIGYLIEYPHRHRVVVEQLTITQFTLPQELQVAYPLNAIPDGPRQQLLVKIALDQIILRTHDECLGSDLRISQPRQQDDRHPRGIRLQADIGFQPETVGQGQIQEYQVYPLLVQDLPRLRQMSRRIDLRNLQVG